MSRHCGIFATGVLAIVSVIGLVRAQGEVLERALLMFSAGQTEPASKAVDEYISKNPNDARGYYVRGRFHAARNLHTSAVADLSRALALKPDVQAFDLRGSEYFKLGKIAESAADFDKVIELRAGEKPQHWRRGITLYYAGRFKDGVEQFDSHQTVNPNDVENAVWHYLCNVKVVGAGKARQQLLKTGLDRRVPMMTIFKLFAGDAAPGDVLKEAETGELPIEVKKERLFYAHLYLGLYFEAAGDAAKSLDHMTKAAVEFANPHYMGDVARVHAELRKPKP